MSRLYGPIRQNGYVVRDLDAAMRYWTEVLGVGPFFKIEHIRGKNAKYRGRTFDTDTSVALANSGDLQIELIQQNNDAPTMFSEFLDKHGEGLQHICVWCDDYEGDMERLKAAGHTLLSEAETASGTKVAFLDSPIHGGSILEMVKPSPGLIERCKLIREAADNWDGADPVRSFTAEEWGRK